MLDRVECGRCRRRTHWSGQGLIHAGAETSLLTLWDVQDQSASQLMKLFYSHVATGRTKAVGIATGYSPGEIRSAHTPTTGRLSSSWVKPSHPSNPRSQKIFCKGLYFLAHLRTLHSRTDDKAHYAMKGDTSHLLS